MGLVYPTSLDWFLFIVYGFLRYFAFLFYIKDTRVGLWGYTQFDKIVDYCRDYLGWTWLNQDPDAWKKVNPKIAAKIGELEARILELETPQNGMMQK